MGAEVLTTAEATGEVTPSMSDDRVEIAYGAALRQRLLEEFTTPIPGLRWAGSAVDETSRSGPKLTEYSVTCRGTW